MAPIRLLVTLLLLVLSGLEIFYVLVWAPVVGAALWSDGSKLAWLMWGRGAAGLVLVLFVGWMVAFVSTIAAIGVGTGHKVGWWLAVVASVAWLLTGCAPLALLSLGILLLPDVREQVFSPPLPRTGVDGFTRRLGRVHVSSRRAPEP
jgi:hypothetical protein